MGGMAAIAVFSLCLLGGDDLVLAQANAADKGSLPNLIATRQTMFFIPFSGSSLDRVQAEAAVRVQLWLSRDWGRTWRLWEEVSSGRREFLFRAESDGEFWFVARKCNGITGRSQSPPCEGTTPELRVLVDTQPPKLLLQAWRGEAGQICSHWAVDEPFIQPGSLQILYRIGRKTSPGRSPWREVAVGWDLSHHKFPVGWDSSHHENSCVNRRPTPSILQWCTDADADFVEIRAKIVDLAGNTAISHAYVDMSGVPLDRPGSLGDSGNQVMAAEPHLAR